MSSGIWQLGVESHDFSHVRKAGQIHKMTTIFTQNNNLGPTAKNLKTSRAPK